MAGVAISAMSYQDIIEKCVPYATSHAWQLGRAVIRALRMGQDPVKAVLSQEKGVVIITGQVYTISLYIISCLFSFKGEPEIM